MPEPMDADWSWSLDCDQAQWWVDRLGPIQREGLGGIVPAGFEAVTRVFHPIEHDGGRLGTWAELAEANDQVVHPEMQLHAIAAPRTGADVSAGVGAAVGADVSAVVGASEGDLPDPPRSTLAQLLAEFTSTPDRCWYGVWDGYGRLNGGAAVSLTSHRFGRWWRRPRRLPGLAPADILDGRRIRAPDRDYLLLQGPLDSVEAITTALGRQCPNLWWPEDRAWFVITEIDFTWTYVAGPEAMARAIERCDGIEALRSGLAHRRTVDGDRVNGRPESAFGQGPTDQGETEHPGQGDDGHGRSDR